jgi:predicted TIM-barrel fold metal-dependent hydrolase
MLVGMVPMRASPGQAVPLADYHQHLFSPATAALISPPNGPPVAPILARDLIALLDSAGIRRAVVLSMGYTWGAAARSIPDEYDKVRAENDWTASQVAMHPDRLVAFCSVNPVKPYALEEVGRCARDPYLRRGLKMHFGNADADVTDSTQLAQVRRVFRAANDVGMAIIVHARANVTRRRPYGAHEARIFLEQILPEAPDVPVQVAHLAGAGDYSEQEPDPALAVYAEAIERGDPRTRRLLFDVAAVVRPSATPEKLALVARRIRQIGVQRVLFGADAASGPNQKPREAWAEFRKLPLTEAEFRAIAANIAPYLR